MGIGSSDVKVFNHLTFSIHVFIDIPQLLYSTCES